MPLVNMTIEQLAAHHSKDEFFREHFTNYFGMLMKTRRLGAQWIAQHTEEITEFEGYEDIYHSFRSSMIVPVSVTWFCNLNFLRILSQYNKQLTLVWIWGSVIQKRVKLALG